MLRTKHFVLAALLALAAGASRPACGQAPAPRVRVLAARNPAAATAGGRWQPGDYVVLTVRDLRRALHQYQRPASDLRLYLSGVLLPAAPVALDTLARRDTAQVRFQLQRTPATDAAWQLLAALPAQQRAEPLPVGLGFDTGQLGPAYAAPVQLVLVPPGRLALGLGLVAGLLGLFGWLAARTSLIRSSRSALTPTGPGRRRALLVAALYRQVPFSLAKSQLAYWSALVLAGYVLIWVVTAALPTIPSGLLGLLGISVANGVVGRLINQTQDRLAAGTLPLLPGQADALGPSQGWLPDVLTDPDGLSVSRLQFVVFNAVVGGYLVQYVSQHWALPELDSSVLALLSISSAGFLAQKNREVPPPPTPATNPAPASQLLAPVAPPARRAARLAPAAPAAAGADPALDSQAELTQQLAEFQQVPAGSATDPGPAIFGPAAATAGSFELQVQVVAPLRGGLSLQATVRSSGLAPLPRQVLFLLHPSYAQRVVAVPPAADGQAHYAFFAGGPFTLLALLPEAAHPTVLAYDLQPLFDAAG